jgi:uncharacterized RDD family membrane protein YckC
MLVSCTNHPAVSQGILRCTRCARPFCPACVIRLRGFVYCGGCKGEQVRDIQSGSVSGALELATLGRRFGAMSIDGLLNFVVVFSGLMLMGLMLAGARSDVTGIVFGFGFAFVYEGALLQLLAGQTLGKRALGIKVVTPDGSDISPGQAWGRAFIRTFFNYFVIIDYLPAAMTKERTCLHDMLAKTRVVRVRS